MRQAVMIAAKSNADVQLLTTLIASHQDFQVVAYTVSGAEALNILQQNSFDLIFLDLDMPVHSGFEIMQMLRDCITTPVIATTSLPDLAVQAYEHGFSDFLIMPVVADRFEKAIGRIRHKQNGGRTSNKLVIQIKGHRHVLNHEDILYVKSHGRKTVIHCRQQDIVVSLMITELYRMLPAHSFIKVHRQYLVNIKHVLSLDCDSSGHYSVRLDDDDDSRIPVGRYNVPAVAVVFAQPLPAMP